MAIKIKKAASRLDINTDYEAVAAGQTDQVLGATGAVGDLLERLIISVTAAATATVSIKDGAGAAIPISGGAATYAIGVFSVEIGAKSTGGAWKVTTGAGCSVLAIGKFT